MKTATFTLAALVGSTLGIELEGTSEATAHIMGNRDDNDHSVVEGSTIILGPLGSELDEDQSSNLPLFDEDQSLNLAQVSSDSALNTATGAVCTRTGAQYAISWG